jgi:hypothetical protein
LFLCLLSTPLAGCKSSERSWDSTAWRRSPVRIRVVNENFLDVTVSARGDGARIRLGEVVGKSSATFSIRPGQLSMNTGLRLQADPIGSRDVFISPHVFPDPRGEVVLRIAPRLEMSTVSVR